MFRTNKGPKRKISFYDLHQQGMSSTEKEKKFLERMDKIRKAPFEERRLIAVCYVLEYYFYNLKFPFIGNIVGNNGVDKPIVEQLLHEMEDEVLSKPQIHAVWGRRGDRESLGKNLRNYQLRNEWLDNSKKRNPFFFNAFEIVKNYVERYKIISS